MASNPAGARSDFANRVRDRMALHDISVRGLAKQLDVNKDTVNAWRQGESEPEMRRLPPLATALGTSVGALLGDGQQRPPEPSSQEAVEMSQEAVEIVRRLASSKAAGLVEPLQAAAPDLLRILSDAQRYVRRQSNGT